MSKHLLTVLLTVATLTLTACGPGDGEPDVPPTPAPGEAAAEPQPDAPADTPTDEPDASADDAATEKVSLFDGKTLGQWKKTDFSAGSEPKVDDGRLIVPAGEVLSGVNWSGELPATMNYEVEFDTMRLDGNDFFCGFTFPVGDDPCTLIMGGWGGGVTGLSSIDGYDASENETSSWVKYDSEKWYHVRVRVANRRIQVWLDGEEKVDIDVSNRRVGVRIEVERSRPMGFATYQTTGAYKDIVFRKLDAAELEASANEEAGVEVDPINGN